MDKVCVDDQNLHIVRLQFLVPLEHFLMLLEEGTVARTAFLSDIAKELVILV